MKTEASLEGCRLLQVGEEVYGVACHRIDEGLYSRMRSEMRPPRSEPAPYAKLFLRHKTEPLSIWMAMALEIGRTLECPPPTDCLESRNAQLQVHQDVTNPYPSTNALVVFSEGMDGGELVFPKLKLAVSMFDACLITFDGSKIWHGNTKLKPRTDDSWRVSVNYYLANE